MTDTNTQHKDRLFKFIFGNPDHKEWTLSLYNALNGSSYTDAEAIEFSTIDDALYMGMRNDVSFIIAFVMNLWEHQSSVNPNLPIRLLIYAVHLYEKHIASVKFNRFSRKLQRLPKPKLICFYNGTENQPEEQILRLSDAFGSDDGDIEVRVRMLNINYGHNMELMKFCGMLNEYAWFVDVVRSNQRIMNGLEEAIDAAINEMPDEFKLKKFLVAHRAEVKGMYLTEYNIEKEMENLREEERAEGREQGRAEGREQGRAEGREQGRAEGREVGLAEGISDTNKRVASDMLRKSLPLTLIEEISRLSANEIRNIAGSLGITVA